MSENKQVIYPIEKVVAVLSYFTSGLAGLIYLLIALAQKQGLRSFLRYHVFMSIFLSITIYIISVCLIGIINILGAIPYIKAIVFAITVMMTKDIFSFAGMHFSVNVLIVACLMTYMSVGAVLGKYTYLPWLSEVVSYNMRQ